MAARRTAPLIALVAVGAALTVARLHQVQILQREVWSEQAAGLVRAGSIRPYARGAILDARGCVLRSDRASFSIEFVYREFRRGHPLGIVAHARAALSGRAQPLEQAWPELEHWSEELLALTPAQLDAFARGAALELDTLRVEACDEPEQQERAARRADVRFYAIALLELSRDERRELVRLAAARAQASWLELAAQASGRSTSLVLERVRARVAAARLDLAVLAGALARERRAAASDSTPTSAEQPSTPADDQRALEQLLRELDQHRERVEDASASALFFEAAGFAPQRIDPQLLQERVELEWINVRLGWDAARQRAWLEREREVYRQHLGRTLPERIATQLELHARGAAAPERVLESWSAPFLCSPERGDELEWRRARSYAALDQLTGFVEHQGAPARLAPAFEAALAEASASAALDWREVARVELGPNAAPEEIGQAAERWADAFDGRFDRAFARERSAGLLARWEQELQSVLRARLEPQAAGGGRWRVRAERLERVGERARFVLKDHGNRPRPVLARPSYELTHLLARHRERFAGFVVQDAHERTARLGSDGLPVAQALIGAVGAPSYQEELEARELREEFRALARKGLRAESDASELMWLAQTLTRPDELRGRAGIEGYFDRELAGRNGYRETRGMQELIDGAYELDVPPVDGADLTLTLELDLQEAAARVLAAPAGSPDPRSCDYAWLARPTGAIVLMRVDGAVLAAASHPVRSRASEGRSGIADEPWERTLRKPGFQPPGSSFKPFVAAWALARLDAFDPQRHLECALLPDGQGAGYVDVRCNVRHGHGAVDLRDALKRSCNSYFAMLGERFTTGDWRALAAEFGFGAPTGVRGQGRRPGLLEDSVPELFAREVGGRGSRLVGNGLALVEVTPMQLARATAALATGALPQVRLVERIGANVVAPSARPLSLPNAALGFVREALEACSNEAGGSAREALHEGELGWRMAAKTGSADIGVERVETADGQARVRKHTWLAGYFPAHAPRYVLVVFCHDTLATASHSSIWLARQFLQRAEVREFVEREAAAR